MGRWGDAGRVERSHPGVHRAMEGRPVVIRHLPLSLPDPRYQGTRVPGRSTKGAPYLAYSTLPLLAVARLLWVQFISPGFPTAGNSIRPLEGNPHLRLTTDGLDVVVLQNESALLPAPRQQEVSLRESR